VRYLLLDRIVLLEPPERARGIKCVSLSDDVLADHFPGMPLMPGTLVTESMAQLGGTLIEATMRARGRDDLYAILVMIERAKFRHVVRPGDQLELEATTLAVSDAGAKLHVEARVGDRLVSDADLAFGLHTLSNRAVIEQRKALLDTWLRRDME